MITLIAPVAARGVDSEEIAADPLGGGHFIIRSVPVVAEGIALGDIVACVTVDGRPHIDRVTVPGGNTTLRVLVDAPFAASVRTHLVALECPVVESLPGLFAISVAPDAPGEGLREWLAGLAEQGVAQLAGGR